MLAAAAATVYVLIRLEAAPTAGRYAWLGLALALGHPVEAHLPRLRRRPRAGGADRRPLPAAPPGSAGDRDPPGGGRPAPAVRVLARRPPGRPRALRPAGRSRRARAPSPLGVLDGLGAVLRALAYYAAPLGLVFLALFPEIYRGRPRRRRARESRGAARRAHAPGRAGASRRRRPPEPARPAEVPLGHPALLPPAALRVLAPRSAGDRRRAAPAPRRVRRGPGARRGAHGRRDPAPDPRRRACRPAGAAQHAVRRGRGARSPPTGSAGARSSRAPDRSAATCASRSPSSRVASLETPGYLPPPAAGGDAGECLLVWDHGTGDAVPDDLGAWLRARLDVEGPAALPVGRLTAPYRHTPAREYRAFFVRLPEGAGRCR